MILRVVRFLNLILLFNIKVSVTSERIYWLRHANVYELSPISAFCCKRYNERRVLINPDTSRYGHPETSRHGHPETSRYGQNTLRNGNPSENRQTKPKRQLLSYIHNFVNRLDSKLQKRTRNTLNEKLQYDQSKINIISKESNHKNPLLFRTPEKISIKNNYTLREPSTENIYVTNHETPTGLIITVNDENIPVIQQRFLQTLDRFDRKYYNVTSDILISISPADRRENGISFVESGLFLYLILVYLSTEVDQSTRTEIESVLSLKVSNADKTEIIQQVLDILPKSTDDLKFQWSTRLLVNGTWYPRASSLNAIRLKFERISDEDTPTQLMKTLNEMVERDSGGVMRNTFEEDELAGGVGAVLVSTVHVRPRWHASPTLLNGTYPFRDAHGAPARATRMIRINDVMRYADLPHWDAQAVEISYATPGLSLLLLVPRGTSLRPLSNRVVATNLVEIMERMKAVRVAVTLPIYTLRMTLLLPNKLKAMGITRLIEHNNTTSEALRISHAIQRLMFWAEAGFNAFKDDGDDWDDRPELQMIVDRPYLFYVRWRNLTLMNGNFVL